MLRPDKRLIILGVGLALVAVVATGVLATILLAPRRAGSRTANPMERVVAFTSTEPAVGVEIRVPDLGWDWPLGTTPFSASVSLPAGTHTYLAAAPGYRATNGQFTITNALEPLQVQVPAMPRLGGQIEVRSSAAAQIAIDGAPVGSCEPNEWTPLGRYDPGRYTVQASTTLGTQQMTIAVGQNSGGRADFYWGSRLVVVVVLTNVVSLTVTVDGRPYARPLEYGYADVRTRPFVQVQASAPGYLDWAEAVFLQPGDVTTATITLTPDTRKADVLAAYWHYWKVLTAAYQGLDASQLSTVITGTLLERETQAIGTLGQYGIVALVLEPAPHTPTVEIVSATTATVRAELDLQQTSVQQDGSVVPQSDHLSGVYTLTLGADDAWRVTGWTSLAGEATAPPPTPIGSGGGYGSGGDHGGGGQVQPADRGLVAQIVVASINCTRQANGMGPLSWDQAIADTLAPLAERATQEFRERHVYSQELSDAVNAALQPHGARVIGWWGIELSYVASSAKYGMFAADWENYVNNPCDTHYANTWAGKPDMASLSRVGIAIGTPYWDGAWWRATIIIAASR